MPIFDHSLAEFPRLSGEESDDSRILRAIEQCERGVLYIPKGIYRIVRKTSPHATLYSGDRAHLVWTDNLLDGFEAL